MKTTYDSDADALYFEISPAKIARSQEIDTNTVLDLDESGDIVGVELLFVKERHPELVELFMA